MAHAEGRYFAKVLLSVQRGDGEDLSGLAESAREVIFLSTLQWAMGENDPGINSG